MAAGEYCGVSRKENPNTSEKTDMARHNADSEETYR